MENIDMINAVSGYSRTAAAARLLPAMSPRRWSLGAGVCPAPFGAQYGGHAFAGAVIANADAAALGGFVRVTRPQVQLSTRHFEKHHPGFPDLRLTA